MSETCPFQKKTPDQNKETTLVRDSSRQLVLSSEEGHFQRTLESIAENVSSLLNVHQAAVSFIKDLNFESGVHAIYLSQKYEKYRTYDVLPIGCGIWGAPMEDGITRRMTQEELEADPRWKHFSDLKDARGLEHPPLRGWLAVPVLAQDGKPIGLIQASDKYEGNFSIEDEKKLVEFTRLAANIFEIYNLRMDLVSAQEESDSLAQLNHRLSEAKSEIEKTNNNLALVTRALSHDLRGQLNHISEAADLLKNDFDKIMQETDNKWFSVIVKSTNRIKELMETLLKIARSSNDAIEKEQLDMNSIVAELISDINRSQDSKKINWKIHQLYPSQGDRLLIDLIWTNLLTNAIKFSQESLSINIELGSRVEDDKNVIYYVKDNGIGIEEDKVEQLFDPFQRGAAKPHVAGFGLGLANARELVRRHGGDLWAESNKEGKGSTFYFSLPI